MHDFWNGLKWISNIKKKTLQYFDAMNTFQNKLHWFGGSAQLL